MFRVSCVLTTVPLPPLPRPPALLPGPCRGRFAVAVTQVGLRCPACVAAGGRCCPLGLSETRCQAGTRAWHSPDLGSRGKPVFRTLHAAALRPVSRSYPSGMVAPPHGQAPEPASPGLAQLPAEATLSLGGVKADFPAWPPPEPAGHAPAPGSSGTQALDGVDSKRTTLLPGFLANWETKAWQVETKE